MRRLHASRAIAFRRGDDAPRGIVPDDRLPASRTDSHARSALLSDGFRPRRLGARRSDPDGRRERLGVRDRVAERAQLAEAGVARLQPRIDGQRRHLDQRRVNRGVDAARRLGGILVGDAGRLGDEGGDDERILGRKMVKLCAA